MKCVFLTDRAVRANGGKDGNCKALTKSDNCSPACAFYATAAQAKVSRARADKRLRSLPNNQQRYIAETYYGGMRPWQR